MSRFVGTCVITPKSKNWTEKIMVPPILELYLQSRCSAPQQRQVNPVWTRKTFHAASVTTGDRFRDASPIDRKRRSQILTRTANRSERLRRKKMPTRQLFSQRTCWENRRGELEKLDKNVKTCKDMLKHPGRKGTTQRQHRNVLKWKCGRGSRKELFL